ncbi:sensor histidine kinase [Microbacterium resistens]|nr:sensor histidine kinase [Microbacterium resistens]
MVVRFAPADRDKCHGPIVGRVSTASDRPAPAADPSPGARQLARGITATWWYTASAVIAFEVAVLFLWAVVIAADGTGPAVPLTMGLGGSLWVASTLLLLWDYRRRGDADRPRSRWRLVAPVLVAVVFGVLAGYLTGSWVVLATPVAQCATLWNWPKGVRLRVVVGLTGLLLVLAVIDGARGIPWLMPVGWVPVFFAVTLPSMSVTSLWWWDVLVALDRARLSEARLAATQERLRVATDVHDLQGHHLQVIALQLELAERLMGRDPDAALEQLRAARASVDEARQGTRDLALRFRSVPLGDELANARDLLAAAGLAVEADIAADADEAPTAALGPVIRETTTNVLRHGGGRRARLTLRREAAGWRYEIVNDAPSDRLADADGSGLEGIERRITEAGGTIRVRRGADEFALSVSVPDGDAR